MTKAFFLTLTFLSILVLFGIIGIIMLMSRDRDWFDDDPEPKQGDLFEADRPPPICPECGERQFYAAKYGKCYRCGQGIE